MKPTIGRIVLFTFHKGDFADNHGYSTPNGQAETVPAIITAVWGDECINLTVFPDGDGVPINITSMPLKTEYNEEYGAYWEWPPRV